MNNLVTLCALKLV